jgi:hypothetical protein
MDVRQVAFYESSFDVAIEKATLDAMLYGSLWGLEDEVQECLGICECKQRSCYLVPFS